MLICREYEYPCPALRDPDHTLVAQTGATVTPEAVVFDSDWTIAYRGRINDEFEDFGKSRDVAEQARFARRHRGHAGRPARRRAGYQGNRLLHWRLEVDNAFAKRL